MNSQTNIKAIIFDFGQVLGNFDHMKACNSFTKFCTLNADDIYTIIFNSELEKKYDKGEISDKEFYNEVKKKIKINKDLSFDEFSNIWGDIFSPNPKIEQMLEGMIKPSIPFYLLSNTNHLHWNYIERLSVIQNFFTETHKKILSFEVGARKPTQEIYLEGIKRTGVSPKEIVYIDDIPKYTSVFRDLGGNTIDYDCTKTSLKKLEDELKLFNLLV